MTWQERYNVLLDKIARKPIGTFPAVYITKPYPILKKCVLGKDNGTFNLRLTDSATEQDYKDFCELLCAKTNQKLSTYFKEFKQFSK